MTRLARQEYTATLVAVDVATGWTDWEAVWGVGQQRVGIRE